MRWLLKYKDTNSLFHKITWTLLKIEQKFLSRQNQCNSIINELFYLIRVLNKSYRKITIIQYSCKWIMMSFTYNYNYSPKHGNIYKTLTRTKWILAKLPRQIAQFRKLTNRLKTLKIYNHYSIEPLHNRYAFNHMGNQCTNWTSPFGNYIQNRLI